MVVIEIPVFAIGEADIGPENDELPSRSQDAPHFRENPRQDLLVGKVFKEIGGEHHINAAGIQEPEIIRRLIYECNVRRQMAGRVRIQVDRIFPSRRYG